MAGISSKAALKTLSAYKYNGGSELEDEGGLDYYNTFYRNYDAQIGRFTGVDVMAESNAGVTPFHFGGNNPILFNDPLGDRERQMREEDEDPGMKDLGNNLTIKTRGMVDFDKWLNKIDEGILEQRMNLGGGVSQVAGGFKFEGQAAQNLFEALQNVCNPDGDWSFMIGESKGRIGYWQSFNPGEGANGGSYGLLSEVMVGTKFVNLGNDGGNISPKSFNFTPMYAGSNVYEAGVSNLWYDVTVPQLFSADFVKRFDFQTLYVQFPIHTKNNKYFNPVEAARITATSFQEAITSVALLVQAMSEEAVRSLSWRDVQNMFTNAASFFISYNIEAQGIVTNKAFGKTTIVTPAVWGP